MSREFKDMYPGGMNKTIALFEKAFHEIMSTDEIDKVMKSCKKDKVQYDHLKGCKAAFEKGRKWYEYHYLIALNEIKSIDLLKDIIAYMVTLDDNPRVRDDYDAEKHKKFVKTIRDGLTKRDMLEGLAEEAGELSKAAIKLIRASGYSANRTPVTIEEAETNLVEEICDILAYCEVLGIDIPPVGTNPKWERWAKRVSNKG